VTIALVAELLGWAATAVFVGSYFCTRDRAMRAVQMAGAAMWIGYGVVIHASPVIVANLLVFGAAAWTLAGASAAVTAEASSPRLRRHDDDSA
jgi:hypothetical protein